MNGIVLMAEQTATLRSALAKFHHQTAEDLGLHLSWQKTKIQPRPSRATAGFEETFLRETIFDFFFLK